jgi:hypothetical protein
MNNKLKEGDTFRMGAVDCHITGTATFSGQDHYGFTFIHNGKPGQPPKLGCGWMPVYFVENFTGYHHNGGK